MNANPANGTGPARGRFITFEGGEGTGKSTQIQRLVARLASLGIETVATREPGGSPKAERLREIILSGAIAPFGPEAETLAFAAARIDHIDHTIRPALEEGCFVVCDRFMDSTRAYQGAQGKVDPRLIAQLEKVTVAGFRPDLTIVLDLPAATGMHRAAARRGAREADRFEAEDLAFHETVRQAFLDIAKAEPGRCAIVDADQDIETVSGAVWDIVSERLLKTEAGEHKRRGRPPRDPAVRTPNLRIIEGSSGFPPSDRNKK